jgi:hypothetical protein
MKYDLEKRVFLANSYIKFESIVRVQRAFRTKYKFIKAPNESVIKNIVNNFKNNGSVCRKIPKNKKKTVRTEATINSIKNLFLENNNISLRKIANLVPASLTTIRKVARVDLNLKPYKKKKNFYFICNRL